MKKKEFVYRELLEQKKQKLTQLQLSKTLNISLSTINNALKPLVKMGAVEILQRGLKVIDSEKTIVHWANCRNLEKDIIYSTRLDVPVRQIESSMPRDTIFTAYSGYCTKYDDVPADYSEVFVYADKKTLDEIKERFPKNEKKPNIFVLESDDRLIQISEKNTAPVSQIFVDLWNLKEWYAKDFVNALREKLQ